MSHQGLKDKMLAEVRQCVLLKGPLTLLAIVLSSLQYVLSFTGHVANVVRPQIVRIQQLVGQLTVPGLLCCLDDREGIVGEENLAALLTMKLGAKGPRVSASGPTTAPAKRMGLLAHILSS
jgi:hypothetical protein